MSKLYDIVRYRSDELGEAEQEVIERVTNMMLTGWRPVGGVSVAVETVEFTRKGHTMSYFTVSQAIVNTAELE